MTNAGWYPDPAGTPNTYRYWDGRAWSESTSTDPYADGPARQQSEPRQQAPEQPTPPTPPGPSPYQPSPYQQPTFGTSQPSQPSQPAYGAMPSDPGQQVGGRQEWSPMPGGPTPPGGGSSRTGLVVAIAVGSVVLLILVIALVIVGVHSLRHVDTSAGPQGQATESQSPDQTLPGAPVPSGPSAPLGTMTPTVMECGGGHAHMVARPKNQRLTAGGLSAPSLQDHGYEPDPLNVAAFEFAGETMMTSKQVSQGWMSPVLVAQLPKASGFTDVETSARTVVECMADNPIAYAGAYQLDQRSARSTKVDGHKAFTMTADIRVKDTGVTVPGDTVTVTVVDTGDKKGFGVFVMAVPIGDKSLMALMNKTAAKLSVR